MDGLELLGEPQLEYRQPSGHGGAAQEQYDEEHAGEYAQVERNEMAHRGAVNARAIRPLEVLILPDADLAERSAVSRAAVARVVDDGGGANGLEAPRGAHGLEVGIGARAVAREGAIAPLQEEIEAPLITKAPEPPQS